MYSCLEVQTYFTLPETLLQSWRQFYIFKNIFHKSENKITLPYHTHKSWDKFTFDKTELQDVKHFFTNILKVQSSKCSVKMWLDIRYKKA